MPLQVLAQWMSKCFQFFQLAFVEFCGNLGEVSAGDERECIVAGTNYYSTFGSPIELDCEF